MKLAAVTFLSLVSIVLSPLALGAPAQSQPVKIPGLDALKIKYTAQKKAFVQRLDPKQDPEVAELHATDKYVLKIQFPSLTQEQFRKLAQDFKNTTLEYKSGQSYTLEQFLPPFVQALNNRQFKPVLEKYAWPDFSVNVGVDEDSVELEDLRRFADMETPLGTYINCWTTVYEFLRTWSTGDKTVDVTWLSRSTATYALMESHGRKLNAKERRQFGDVLIFSSFDDGPGEYLIQHAAIFVMPGLYFEKTDTDQDNSFRFVLEKDLLAKYKEILPKKSRSAHYRLKTGAVLPKLSESENLLSSKDLYGKWFSEDEMRTLSFQFDWIPGITGTAKPKFEPYRLHSIQLVQTPTGWTLDSNSVIAPNFLEPKWTK